jgi:hypothetical protein
MALPHQQHQRAVDTTVDLSLCQLNNTDTNDGVLTSLSAAKQNLY